MVPKLSEAKHFAVTSDFWTSITHVPFMSFTVHFIDEDWILRSYCLDTIPTLEKTLRVLYKMFLKTGNLALKSSWLPPLIMLQTMLLLLKPLDGQG